MPDVGDKSLGAENNAEHSWLRLFVGGEPKVGKSLLVANLALSLAAGSNQTSWAFQFRPRGAC